MYIYIYINLFQNCLKYYLRLNVCGLRLSIVISNDLGYLQPITFEKLYTNVFIGKDRQLGSTTKNLENTYSYKPILKAICRMAFIAITNRSNLCQYKMRSNYYKSGQIYFKSGRLLQIVANIANWCRKYVYSGRVIFIKTEDHNYEF